MSNFCPNCESLQSNAVGTAPERPPFQQPTKYDHYENFRKFKQLKENESQLVKRKEQQLKLNQHFTDLSKEDFEQLSLQEVNKVRCQLHYQNRENMDSEYPKSLLALTRNPVQCPISVCGRMIGVTFVLSHFLRDHNQEFGVPCEEIYTDKRSILKFDPTALTYEENVCLGILAYGGDANESFSRPSERGICKNNAFLPKPYEHLVPHLPILIMACQTSWSALLGNRKEENKLLKPNLVNQELLVLWLTSPQTVKPIHCTVTVYDKLMLSSRGCIMQIRDLNAEQSPADFMPKETNFMRLSHGDINILSRERTENIHMEIMINEYS